MTTYTTESVFWKKCFISNLRWYWMAKAFYSIVCTCVNVYIYIYIYIYIYAYLPPLNCWTLTSVATSQVVKKKLPVHRVGFKNTLLLYLQHIWNDWQINFIHTHNSSSVYIKIQCPETMNRDINCRGNSINLLANRYHHTIHARHIVFIDYYSCNFIAVCLLCF